MARIKAAGVVLVAAVAVFGVFAPRGSAQAPPTITLPGITPTTPAPTTTNPVVGEPTTTAPTGETSPGDSTTTTIDVSQDGDAGSPTGGGEGQVVPPDAQAEI